MLSVVALIEELPEQGLRRGQVGTIVENLAPGVYEVEFSDDDASTYASVALPPTDSCASITNQSIMLPRHSLNFAFVARMNRLACTATVRRSIPSVNLAAMEGSGMPGAEDGCFRKVAISRLRRRAN